MYKHAVVFPSFFFFKEKKLLLTLVYFFFSFLCYHSLNKMSTLKLCNSSHFILAPANSNQPFILYHSTEAALLKTTRELHVTKSNAQVSAFLPPDPPETFEYSGPSQCFGILCSLIFTRAPSLNFLLSLLVLLPQSPLLVLFISYQL